MSDLISRQDAIDAIKRKAYRHTYLDQIIDIINQMPSAEIIRCKDCKRYDTHDHRCRWWNHGVKVDDYCSHAERRTDE